MSGIIFSSYILEQRRQMQLRLAYEEEQKRKIAYKSIQNLLTEIPDLINQLEEPVRQMEVIVNETTNSDSILQSIKDTIGKAKKISVEATGLSEDTEVRTLESQRDTLKDMYDLLTHSKVTFMNTLAKTKNAFQSDAIDIIVEGFDISFSNLRKSKEVVDNDVVRRINEISLELGGMHLSEQLLHKWKRIQNKANEIDNIDFIENFYSMTIYPFLKECRKFNDEYTNAGSEYKELIIKYEVLTEELGIEQEIISFSIDDLEFLRAETERLENVLKKNREYEYISRTVDDVMIELGYKLAGNRNVTKKNGRKFQNELFTYHEGTAVNVTYSDTGQIAMELGGLDEVDRIPDDREAEALTDEMHSFCNDYKQIEQLLKQRGIEMTRLNTLPPEPQYAQIINVSDYKLHQSVTNFKALKTKRNSETTNSICRED